MTGLQAQEMRTVKGTVSDGQKPMEDVRIEIQGKETQTFSDAEGKYELRAEVGDLLRYSYTGMRDYIVRVEDVTRYLNLVMIPDIEELEEVTVTGSNRMSQEDMARAYATNPQIMKTAFGYINVDRFPGRSILINPDMILPIQYDLFGIIRNRFAGVTVMSDAFGNGQVVIRGMGSIENPRAAIYDLDGLVLTEPPLWLDVNQIKRIAIISNLAYTARYGAIGGGGVVVINTLSGNPQDPKLVDQARLRNNYYKGDALDQAAVASDLPTYQTELQKTNTFAEAREVYNRYEARYRSSPYFFLDAYRHFYDRLGEEAFADELIEANFQRFEGNAVLLKALAYLYQEQGRSAEALETMKEVFILRPHYSQSYLDLANAYRDAGQYDKAARMFFRYQYLVDENFLVASGDFTKIMQHESDNMLSLHIRDIGVEVDKILTDPYVENTTRVTLEWNDMEAEFEIQFVNPEGQYDIWKHTYADNEERILDEKLKGYSIEEHVIDQALPGTWEVNVRYLGNKSLSPTYLKVTTYYNYGERNQQKQVSTFKLQLKDRWQQLLRINNPGVSKVR